MSSLLSDPFLVDSPRAPSARESVIDDLSNRKDQPLRYDDEVEALRAVYERALDSLVQIKSALMYCEARRAERGGDWPW